jgi:hypothetical protein
MALGLSFMAEAGRVLRRFKMVFEGQGQPVLAVDEKAPR